MEMTRRGLLRGLVGLGALLGLPKVAEMPTYAFSTELGTAVTEFKPVQEHAAHDRLDSEERPYGALWYLKALTVAKGVTIICTESWDGSQIILQKVDNHSRRPFELRGADDELILAVSAALGTWQINRWMQTLPNVRFLD
jgi:hypothetical protein